MIRGKRFLGFIPARGGSKGIPRKNLRLLANRPLIAHTIEHSLQVPEFSAVVVSTDDSEIRAFSLSLGVRVIDRPPELASDTASTEAALLHTLDVLQEGGEGFDYTVILEPTSPLRNPATVQRCMHLAADKDAAVVITVTEMRSNLGRLDGDCFKPLFPDTPRRRQLREPLFAEAGVAYVIGTHQLRSTGWIFSGAEVLAVPVDAVEAIDINTADDLRICAALVEARRST